MMRFLKKHLFWKFFLSYFLLVMISIIVMAVLIRLLLPGVFDSYLGSMERLFSRHGMEAVGHMGQGNRGMRMMGWSGLFTELFAIFNLIILEAILYAILPSVVIALVLSSVMSRRFVKPLQKISRVADQVAAGHYQERLPESDTPPGVQDELEQLAVRFNRMTNQLAEVEDMRQKLIGDIAHELRTPLTVIKGSLEGLRDGVLEPDEDTFARIYRQADRLDRLVNELQELNRLEAGVLELRVVKLDLVQLLSELIQTVQVSFSAKGIDLALHVPDVPLLVRADPDRVEQVLINLLNNALQATAGGGKVRVNAEMAAGKARISVIDTGIGIAPEHLEKVFTRFYRVDDSRSRQAGGSGIGLTIAKKLVETMGGEIRVESAGIDHGAAFHFTLPLD